MCLCTGPCMRQLVSDRYRFKKNCFPNWCSWALRQEASPVSLFLSEAKKQEVSSDLIKPFILSEMVNSQIKWCQMLSLDVNPHQSRLLTSVRPTIVERPCVSAGCSCKKYMIWKFLVPWEVTKKHTGISAQVLFQQSIGEGRSALFHMFHLQCFFLVHLCQLCLLNCIH